MTCNIECQYLRPVKAEKLYDAFNKTEYRRGLTSEEYIKATILPVRREECGKPDLGGAVDRNGEYIISSVTPGWASGWYDDYQCTYCEYTAVYCGRMIGHWGHFLLESITRLWFFLEHDDPSYTYVFIVDEGTSPPIIGNFRQFFELLGIIDRLVFLNKPTQYNKVIIPGRSFQSNRFYYQEYSDILDRVIYNSYRTVTACSLEKRIFLSRRYFDRAVKSEVGLEMLDSFFSRNGYNIIYRE